MLTLIVVFDNLMEVSMLMEVGMLADTMFIYYSLIDTCMHLAAPYNTCDMDPSYCLTMSVIQVPQPLPCSCHA